MKRITSRHNPLVATFRDVGRGEAPGLLLDGPHLVAEALGAGIPIRQAAVTAEAMARAEIRTIVERLLAAGAEVASVAAPVMAAISPVRSSSAIVAVAAPRQTASEGVFGNGAQDPLVVIACDVQDPGNVGAIVRVAEAAGATGVIVAGRSADPFGPKALRGSMGSALRLPIGVDSPAEAVAAARTRRCRVHAAVPRNGTSLFDLDLGGPAAILIGGEGGGLAQPLASLADDHFSIPMQEPVESLNAAIAAAIALYEARRQRLRARARVK